jgi:uncharacterized damage-inducible protein DinB
MTERTEPPAAADERTSLESFLDYLRATVLLKADGLSDEHARRRGVPPSDLSIMGLVRHMAEVERHWFQRWLVGLDSPPIYDTDDDPDGDLHPSSTDTLDEAIATYQREIERSRDIVAETPSYEVLSVRTGTSEEPGFQPNLRWIMIHLIEETARHCGHADLLRERIDGTVGD